MPVLFGVTMDSDWAIGPDARPGKNVYRHGQPIGRIVDLTGGSPNYKWVKTVDGVETSQDGFSDSAAALKALLS